MDPPNKFGEKYIFWFKQVFWIGFSIGQVCFFCFALQSFLFLSLPFLFLFVPFCSFPVLSSFLSCSPPLLLSFLPVFLSFPFKNKSSCQIGSRYGFVKQKKNSSLVILQKGIPKFHVFRHKNWGTGTKNSRFTGVNESKFRISKPDFCLLWSQHVAGGISWQFCDPNFGLQRHVGFRFQGTF